MPGFNVIFAIMITIILSVYPIILFQSKHTTQYVDSSLHFDHNACEYIDSYATYISDCATSFITCTLSNNSACYYSNYTTNNRECSAMNTSEFRSNTMNKHTRNPSATLAHNNTSVAITNPHRMEEVLNTKMNCCIAHYETHVDPYPRAPLSQSQSRTLSVEHTNPTVLSLTTDRYRCVANADCYGTHSGQYTTRMEASNSQSSTTVHSTSRVSFEFHTPMSQSMPFDHVAVYPSYTRSSASLLAFFAINHVYCITHMPSVFLWFVLLSHQMIVPAQAQTMNGSSFSCTGYQECLDIQCNDDQDCFVACSGSNACKGANISAPSNANLFVECSYSYSCYEATIFGPSVGNLTVDCTTEYSYSCKNLEIHGPTNGDATVVCVGTYPGSRTRICQSAHIYCPIYGDCNVQCYGHESCAHFRLDAQSMINGTLSLHSVSGFSKYSSVWCPGNDTECIISCESSGPDGGCQSTTIYTKPDTKLFVTAVGTNALKSMTVYCPSGKGTCSIKASGDNYDMLSDLGIYSVNGLNDVALSCNASDSSYCYSVLDPVTIACSSDYGVRGYIALQSGSIDDWHGADANLTSLCNDDTTNGYYGSSFLCSEHSECSSNIFCNDDQDCSVVCDGTYSCQTAKIYAPSNANLVVECSGCGSCQRADIYGAFIGNLIVNCTPCPGTGDECYLSNIHGPTNGNLTVSLDGSGFERYIDIDCPLHGRCDVQCLARDCSQLVLDARGMINGSLSLHSVSSISESTVWCPGNDNECIISCESGGCQSATINTEADSKLFVTAEGTNTLQNTSIYCPTGKSAYINGECSITVASDTYGALSNTYIYAVNGFNGLSLTCNYSSNVTNCYDESLRPRLFCLPDFSVSCDLTLQSEFDVWECQSGSHALMCDWSHSPTSAPTTSPSSAPFHCADYEESSNNGTNETSFRYQTVNESQYAESMDENSEYFLTNQSNTYVMQTIQCNEISDCWVECNVRGSCILATIEIGVNTNGTSFISCSEDASCFGMTITTRAEARMNVIDVICEQKNSCSQMIINISDFDSFNLYCVGHGACEDAAIELHSSSNDTRNDGIIHCISPNSCDDLNIKTNSRRTQLKLFEHSNNVKFDNGIGYLFAIENIFCNNDKFIRLRSWINETEDTIMESISSEYEAASYPCEGLMVQCGDFECTMQYNIQSQSLVQPLNDLELPHMDCYWINVQEIQRVSCVGQCASSPTLQPTSAPSNAPTEITENPTYSPSKSPSISPSLFPTVTPTTAPTVAPSATPSTSPSSAPTLAPSLYPTMSPTKAPSSFPTISPTIAPSVSPSVAPSLSPTISPTKAPSLNPSHSPSQPPTISPTVAPSISPSGIPTGSPTMTPSLAPISSKDFDSYIIIIYVLQGLHEDDIDRFVTHKDTTIAYIETSIKAHYFDPGLLSYAQFMVTIVSVDDVDIKDIDSNTRIQWINLERLELNTKIECDREPINYCESVKQQSQTQNTFARSLRDELRQFFDNEDLVVSVNSPEALTIQCKDCVDGDDQFIYMGIAIVCGVLVFASICAFLFNKRVFPNLPGFHPVDEARWISLIVFAVQFWDFASDANLVSEIWSRPDVHDNVLILYSAYGATTFTAVPYIANLVIASRIKPMVKRNAAASSWFQRYSAIFVLLVVLTGGCYPALSLVSSNIFGLNITSSALTLHELKQMSNIKIYFTIFLENIPQLICQVLYCYASQQISEAVKVAFFASALSVTASTLVFLIDRDTHDMIVVEYFLSTQCDRHRYSQNVTIDDEPDNTEGAGARTISAPIPVPIGPEPLSGRGPSLTAVDQIDDEERNKFISNRGRTEALSEALAELFEMPPKNIEVGYSTLTSCGIVTHIVHYVSQAELDALEEELQKQHEDESASAPYLTRHLYALERKSVRAIFMKHFALNDDFMVEYMTKYSGVRTAARIRAASEKQNDDRSNLFRRMVTHGRLSGETVHDAMSQVLMRYDVEQDLIVKMVGMLPTTAPVQNVHPKSMSVSLSSDGRGRDERKIEMAEIGDGRNESLNEMDLEEVYYMDANHDENSSVGAESHVILNDDEINAILNDVDDVENEMDENV
eukprot:546600_1